MELQIIDYDCQQATQAMSLMDIGMMIEFHYSVNAKSKLNVFFPKVLEDRDCQDKLNVRNTIFGGLRMAFMFKMCSIHLL